jgi:riboflavin kinase/FMN adenylyltransferase
MQHIYGLQDAGVNGIWLSIGKFDGVHLGHQSIIKELTAGAHAAGAPAVVLTFDPHPSMVLRGPKDSFYLSMPEEKAALLGELGVDLVITHPFNHEIAQLSAEEFLRRLDAHLGLEQLWVGHDFTLGHNRQGDVPRLREIGGQMGFSVQEITVVEQGGEIVSSSRIRSLLEAGSVEKAGKLLGRSFTVYGEVVGGEGRGHKLGIPTANLSVPKERVMPGAGVYASWVHCKGKTYKGVTNVGVRPTFEFEPVAPRVETHILDFKDDLYGEVITVSFEARLRGEQRFPGVKALVAQIKTDIEKARTVLKE